MNSDDISYIANIFAKEFHENVMATLHVCNVKVQSSEKNQSIMQSFYLESSSELEVYNILNKLSVKKGAGTDNIRPKDLRNNAETLSKIICNLTL